ncbi:uncharacterized protein LOC108041430 [Drosophila rhopaloa]|uniref:Uncharacterized protein LOC108041430 n=1 Tax=Drosophila rhopaloa TaxID=1041015 RepID=A0A6P4E9V1_DRORH|nr:uncharacterized protein LOC108041430 [Drosophila rhopaloa]
MVENLVKKMNVVLIGLVLATLLRVIIFYTIKHNGFKITTDVISYFIGLTNTIFVIIVLFWASFFLAYLTADWIAVGYIPVLMYVLNWTYYTFSERLRILSNSYDLYMGELSQMWLNYFNYNATNWPTLEKTLQCCGLEGPRSYMSYLQEVPKHCYNPELITLGCSHLVQNIFYPMQQIGLLMFRLTLCLELIILYIYAFKVGLTFGLDRKAST